MERIDLGGLTTSAQGLGCMGMSQSYGQGDWDESIAVIHRALELGVTLLDTADVYGAGHNEVLVGRALSGTATRSSSRPSSASTTTSARTSAPSTAPPRTYGRRARTP